MGALVLDSSVLIGWMDANDAQHEPARAALALGRAREDRFVLPSTTLSEAMVGAYRSGNAADRHRRLVTLFGPVRPIDEQIALTAAGLRARHRSLRLPDALVIATGLVEEATVLTCDKRLLGVHDCVQVIPAD